jgi:uridylate kinase
VQSLINETYEPIVVKLSGEALGGGGSGIDQKALEFLGTELLSARDYKPQIAVVVGGGNFYRGQESESNKINRIQADYVGMLATVMNGVILQQWMQAHDLAATVLSAIPIGVIAEQYSPAIAKQYLKAGSVVILSGGTGSPFFTTDTTASLRALEIGAKTIIKGTKVNGIFDKDPEKFPKAKMFRVLDFDTAIGKRLKVMDTTAFSLCRDNHLAIRVINIMKAGNLRKAVIGEEVGTLVTDKG